MRFPLLGKALALLAVTLLLVAVLSRIEGLVNERRGRADEARVSVEQSLASAQTLLGPLLTRNCVEEWERVVVEGEGKAKERRNVVERREFTLSSSAQKLTITSQADAQPRYRGLFKVNGYGGLTELSASWPTLESMQPQRVHIGSRLDCDTARVMFSLTDVRGIRQAQVQLDGVETPVLPGTSHARFRHGLHAQISAARLEQVHLPLDVKLRLDLIGTAKLALIPAAEETEWTLRSNWPHPSFGGRFLPATREVSEAGFQAQWRVSALASSAARDVHGDAAGCTAAPQPATASRAPEACLDTLDVAFIDPINPYSLTDRATKYALLFITVTFASVALTEVLARRRVHPVQYALVGLAMALFFLLLLSLSEHLSFDIAYAIAAAGCVALLAVYAVAMLGSARRAAAFAAGIALLYGVLWVLLTMEQTALVLGSVMLFAMLSAVMLLTRRVDWYGLASQLQRSQGAEAQAPRSA
jgi:inner membrane protein